MQKDSKNNFLETVWEKKFCSAFFILCIFSIVDATLQICSRSWYSWSFCLFAKIRSKKFIIFRSVYILPFRYILYVAWKVTIYICRTNVYPKMSEQLQIIQFYTLWPFLLFTTFCGFFWYNFPAFFFFIYTIFWNALLHLALHLLSEHQICYWSGKSFSKRYRMLLLLNGL